MNCERLYSGKNGSLVSKTFKLLLQTERSIQKKKLYLNLRWRIV